MTVDELSIDAATAASRLAWAAVPRCRRRVCRRSSAVASSTVAAASSTDASATANWASACSSAT